jgi:class 3 adenylate cyclase
LSGLDTAKKIHEAVSAIELLPVVVGCYFGEVIMGDIGQEVRLDYMLIGPVMNYASRMCDIAGKGENALSKRLLDKLDNSSREKLSESSLIEEIKIKIKPTDPELEAVVLK